MPQILQSTHEGKKELSRDLADATAMAVYYGQGFQRLGTGWSSGDSREGPVSRLGSEPQTGTHLRVSTSSRHALKDAEEPKVTF